MAIAVTARFHQWMEMEAHREMIAAASRQAVAMRGRERILAVEPPAIGRKPQRALMHDAKAARVANEVGAKQVEPDKIFDADAEILAPCALGGVLNDETIPRLRVALVCGAANNQLGEDRHAEALQARGILYVPDYVANAGGIINGAREMGRAPVDSNAAIEAIYDTVLQILAMAASQHIAPARAADRLAEARLRK